MELVLLDSSLLASARYHPNVAVLDLALRDGNHYRYFGVSIECFHQLINADSKGRFFNLNIRNRFAYQHLTDPLAPIIIPVTKN